MSDLTTACAALRNLGVALNDYDQAALDTVLDFVQSVTDPENQPNQHGVFLPVAVGVIEKRELDHPEHGIRAWWSIHSDWDSAQQEINDTIMEMQEAGVDDIPHLVAVRLAEVPDA